jgi:hypothetical protein
MEKWGLSPIMTRNAWLSQSAFSLKREPTTAVQYMRPLRLICPLLIAHFLAARQ